MKNGFNTKSVLLFVKFSNTNFIAKGVVKLSENLLSVFEDNCEVVNERKLSGSYAYIREILNYVGYENGAAIGFLSKEEIDDYHSLEEKSFFIYWIFEGTSKETSVLAINLPLFKEA